MIASCRPRLQSPQSLPKAGNSQEYDLDDYESDFEEYNADDDGQQMADHRMKLLSNVEGATAAGCWLTEIGAGLLVVPTRCGLSTTTSQHQQALQHLL